MFVVQMGLDLTVSNQKQLCAATRAACRGLRSLMMMPYIGAKQDARSVPITQIAEVIIAALQTTGEIQWVPLLALLPPPPTF